MARRALLALLLLIGVAAAHPAAAQTRPLFQPPAPAPAAAPAPPPGFWTRAVLALRAEQMRVQRELAATVRAVRTDYSLAAAWSLLALSFAYGVLHAAGPGHGKVVLASYLVASRSAVRRGIWLASAAAGVQAVVAIALVGVLAILLGVTQRSTAAAVPLLDSVGYGAIAALGLWMLWSALRGHHHHHHHGAPHDHDHGHGHAHDHGPHDHHHHGRDHGQDRPAAPEPRGQTLALVLGMGIRPCSGAVLVLLFALAQGVFLVGVASAFVMAVGTALTTSGLAVLTVVSRQTAQRLVARRPGRWGTLFARGLQVAGALAITVFGALLFFASWGAAPPV